jgi:hypothetical protein
MSKVHSQLSQIVKMFKPHTILNAAPMLYHYRFQMFWEKCIERTFDAFKTLAKKEHQNNI